MGGHEGNLVSIIPVGSRHLAEHLRSGLKGACVSRGAKRRELYTDNCQYGGASAVSCTWLADGRAAQAGRPNHGSPGPAGAIVLPRAHRGAWDASAWPDRCFGR